MRASTACVRTAGHAIGALLVVAAVSGAARADNVVGRIEAHAEGERTVVVIHGTATPSFTAYRLERPSRLVVDLASGKLTDAARDSLLDVDSWAINQISTSQYHNEAGKTARVMIGLKRGCTYDAKPKGNDLYVIVTATDPMPASTTLADLSTANAASQRARDATAQAHAATAQAHEATAQAHEATMQARDAETRRAAVLAQLADEEKRLVALRDARAEEERREKKQGDAQKAEGEATRRAELARAEADTAKARAVAARAELERLQITRAAEEQKIAELSRRAAAGGAAEQQELTKLRAAADHEQARLAALKLEAEKLTQTRTTELRRIDEAQASARAAAARREKALDEARVIAERRAQDATSARLAEERRAQVQAEEAARLVAASQKLASSQDKQKSAEQAAQRMADQARVDEARVKQLRADAERIAQSARVARAQVEAARAETQQLVETQIRERARIESSRIEAKRLADQRQLEMERAAHATAMVSGQRIKMEAAEQEAKRLAEVRQKESLRLDAIRKSAEDAATLRAEELRKIDDARTAQKATVAAHERELASLSERRDRELKSLAEARAGEEAKIATARDEVRRTKSELDALEQQRNTQKEEVARTRAEVEARRAEQTRLDAKLAAAHIELERAEKQARLAALAPPAPAPNKAALAAHERELASLSERRDRELKSLAEARAGEQAKIAAARDAVRRTKSELDALEQQRNTQKEEVARTSAEVEARRAEQTRLDGKLATARTELERAEKQARLAAVVTPAPVPLPVATMTPHTKELARAGVPFTSKVKDVRFTDESDSHRIVIDLQGEPEWRTMPSQKGELTLSLKGAELPRNLERTLDTGAYKGPVRSVSTYGDPSEPGSVRIVVTLDASRKGGEPRLTKEANRLVWEFPREARSQSIAPVRVGGYGASIPLQLSSNATNLPSPSSGRRRSNFSGRRIDLDFKDFDIHNILRMISDVGQVNIITSDDVKGSITIRMRDVPWDQALDVILKAKSLGMQREGNLIRVAPLAVLEKELEAELARAKASIELKPLDTRLIPLSYATGDKMLPRVAELLSSRGKVSVDERTNMLIVSDVASNIALAEDLIRNLDTQTPQVLIEARIVEASQNFTRQVGIQWGGNTLNSAATGNPTGLTFPSTVGVAGQSIDPGTPASAASAANPNYVVNLPAATGSGSGGALGIALGSLSGAYNINLRLSALESTGQVRIVSSPKITTLDNVEASIEQGTAIPISVVSAAGTNTIFVDAKLNLTVKPHVTNEGSIAMNVSVTRNEPDFGRLGARGDPTILKRQAKTEMLVRDGDTAVIGGIYTRNSGAAYQKLPWVADIPILGWLFKTRRENDDRTELLIFITPRIVNRQMVAR